MGIWYLNRVLLYLFLVGFWHMNSLLMLFPLVGSWHMNLLLRLFLMVSYWYMAWRHLLQSSSYHVKRCVSHQLSSFPSLLTCRPRRISTQSPFVCFVLWKRRRLLAERCMKQYIHCQLYMYMQKEYTLRHSD